MKKGNVIATGVKGRSDKDSGRGRRAEKVLPSALKTGAKEKSATKGKPDGKVNLGEQKFLSVAQVAERWGTSETTVRRLMEEGKLNGIRLRYACRLSIESVDKHEESTHF